MTHMDASASTAVMTALGDFSTDAIALFVLVIPLALGLLVTFVGVKKAIKWFRSIARI